VGIRIEAQKEGKKYFIRYYVEREYIGSPWGNYMGSYMEIIEKYTQKLINKERFEDEKKNLYVGNGKEEGKRKEKTFMDEFFGKAESKYMITAAEASMCIGKYYLSEIFENNYTKARALSLLNDIKEGIKDKNDRKSMENFIVQFDEIKEVVKGEKRKGEEEKKGNANERRKTEIKSVLRSGA
jgi:hypothetical protein